MRPAYFMILAAVGAYFGEVTGLLLARSGQIVARDYKQCRKIREYETTAPTGIGSGAIRQLESTYG